MVRDIQRYVDRIEENLDAGRGLWFDVSHAAGNVMIALAAGPELRRMLDRYGARLKTVVVWA